MFISLFFIAAIILGFISLALGSTPDTREGFEPVGHLRGDVPQSGVFQ